MIVTSIFLTICMYVLCVIPINYFGTGPTHHIEGYGKYLFLGRHWWVKIFIALPIVVAINVHLYDGFVERRQQAEDHHNFVMQCEKAGGVHHIDRCLKNEELKVN